MAAQAAVARQADMSWVFGAASKYERTTDKVRTWYRSLAFAGREWDLIYFPWNGGAVAYEALFDLQIPIVLSCRGSQINVVPHDPGQPKVLQALRETFEKAAAVHCVSDAIRLEALKLGLKNEKVTVIRPGVDVDFFCPAEPLDVNTHFRVVSVGSLSWVKGYEYAIHAIRKVVDAGLDVRYTIIGDGPDAQRIRYSIQDLDLQGVVKMMGRLDPSGVRDCLRRSDAVLLSSVSEGISNAVLEAMACGKPVVTTDCGGMREAVKDGAEGFIVPNRDSYAMARALLHLHSSTNERMKMADMARARAIAEFRLDQHVERFAAFFEAAAAQ